MKTSFKIGVATSVLAFALAPQIAQAETKSGVVITNTVTVGYSVDSNAQTDIVQSNDFTVDRKIALTITELGTATTEVSPGQVDAVTTFTVTNLSNNTDVIDLALGVTQQNGGTTANGGTDVFDVTNIRIYQDAAGAGAGTFGPEDTLVTFLDSVASEAAFQVYVVSSIPLGQPTGAVSGVILTGTAHEGGTASALGTIMSQTTGANTAGVDTVFADGAGSDDSARDGRFSARDDYTVLAAALTVTKTSRVISDPFNGTNQPKMIPGAVIEYCIIVANAANGAVAQGVTISDPVPAQTPVLLSFGVLTGGTVTGTDCAGDGTVNTQTSQTQVNANLGNIAAGATSSVVFRGTLE